MHELSLLLDCSLAQVYRFAAHLLYWRKAKLIHTLVVRNIYIVSPQANLSEYVYFLIRMGDLLVTLLGT